MIIRMRTRAESILTSKVSIGASGIGIDLDTEWVDRTLDYPSDGVRCPKIRGLSGNWTTRLYKHLEKEPVVPSTDFDRTITQNNVMAPSA